MQPIKSFFITKNKFKQIDSHPDYKISFMTEDKQFIEVGGAWIKDGKGGKFFSCKLNDRYVDHTKNTALKGYVLVPEAETEVSKQYETTPDSPFEAQNDPLDTF